MYCPNCGTEFTGDQEVCGNCGTSVKKEDIKTPEKKPQNLAGKTLQVTGGLKIWLWLMMVVNGLAVLSNLTILFSRFRLFLYGHSASLIIIATICELAIIAGAYRMLNRYRDGFYIICACSVIAFIINVSSGSGLAAFVGLCLPVIIWLFAKEQWRSFQ